jgi:hypothetical protein
MHAPLDPAAVEAANDLLERLEPLAMTLTNARAFRVLLEDLHARKLLEVEPPHVDAVHMVRAGILRAAISTIMAALDTKSRDRASVGQIVHMLEALDLSVLASRWPNAGFGAATLQQVKDDWHALLQSEGFKNCKAHRDNTVAHTLMLATPPVENEDFFRLHDAAEGLASRLFAICGYGTPDFRAYEPRLTAGAKVFWDTYWKGMASP